MNKYAVSSGELGEILKRSSSSVALSGDSLDQVIAMGASMNEIIQDASTSGTTLKMLALRIRSQKAELEKEGEDTTGMASTSSKTRDQIKALTNTDGKGGFDIMTDNGKSFKTTYAIMAGIASKWKEMNQAKQSALLEIIAGERFCRESICFHSTYLIARAA